MMLLTMLFVVSTLVFEMLVTLLFPELLLMMLPELTLLTMPAGGIFLQLCNHPAEYVLLSWHKKSLAFQSLLQ